VPVLHFTFIQDVNWSILWHPQSSQKTTNSQLTVQFWCLKKSRLYLPPKIAMDLYDKLK
jgi:hypothetical protein